MDSTVLAVRAITTLYGRQLLWPALVVWLSAFAIVIGLSWWLAAAVDTLWWLMAILLTPLFLVGIGIWLLCFVIISRLHPKLDKEQRRLTKDIVAGITTLAVELGTPKFMILAHIVKDVMFGSSLRGSYIGSMASESADTKRKFDELRKSF